MFEFQFSENYKTSFLYFVSKNYTLFLFFPVNFKNTPACEKYKAFFDGSINSLIKKKLILEAII